MHITRIIILVLLNLPMIVLGELKTIKVTPQNFNKVFEQINTNKKGNVVQYVFASGNYIIESPILLSSSNLTLTGSTKNVVFKLKNQNGIVIKGSNIKINNIKFEGSNISAKDFYSGYAILLVGTQNVNISNNVFSRVSGNNIMALPAGTRGCKDVKIIANTFKSPAYTSTIIGADNSAILLGYSGIGYSHESILIESNRIDGGNVLNHGVGVLGHGKNIIVKNNTISNFLSYGVLFYETADDEFSLTNNSIIGNTITNIGEVGNKKTKKGMGIYLMKSHSTVIENNILDNVMRNSDKSETLASGAISINGGQNCTVVNNTILSSNMYGIVPAYAFNTIIESNKILQTARANLYFISCSDLVIQGNDFNSSSRDYIKGFLAHTSSQDGLPSNVRGLDTGTDIAIKNNFFDNNMSTLDLLIRDNNKKSSSGITIDGNYIKNTMSTHKININKM